MGININVIGHYPLSQWEQYQHWWERLTQRLVRQQRVYTQCILLQAYQAELLGDHDEGRGWGLNTVCRLHRATDLSLRAMAAPGGHWETFMVESK